MSEKHLFKTSSYFSKKNSALFTLNPLFPFSYQKRLIIGLILFKLVAIALGERGDARLKAGGGANPLACFSSLISENCS